MTSRKNSDMAHALQVYLAQPVAPFAWAGANCCHWPAGWVQAWTGLNPMAGLAPTPDARAALRLVQSLGGDLRAAWSRQLGAEPIAPLMARVGDIVLFELAEGLRAEGAPGACVGVCTGPRVAVAEASGRLIYLPLDRADAAWRLPEALA